MAEDIEKIAIATKRASLCLIHNPKPVNNKFMPITQETRPIAGLLISAISLAKNGNPGIHAVVSVTDLAATIV